MKQADRPLHWSLEPDWFPFIDFECTAILIRVCAYGDSRQVLMTKIGDTERLKQVTKLGTIECHTELESTMDRAKELAVEASVPLPALVTAIHQNSGRGRRGAGWWQPPGSVAMTLIIEIPSKENLPGGVLPLWSLACGLAVAESLHQLNPDLKPHVRWPNDIEINGRKIGGLLLEATTQKLLIGVGINTDGSKENAPKELHNRLITIPDVLGHTISHDDLLVILIPQLLNTVLDTINPEKRVSILKRYQSHCSLTHTSIKLFDVLYEYEKDGSTSQSLKRATTLSGICRGIDEAGRLRIETPQQTCAVLAGSLTDPSAIWTR
jgi:BirA family biotin operon repressor/biotin-[acetyl-CoA-carboxylase] ligase